MKVYLAAPFSTKEQTRKKAEELRALGIKVTSRWLNEKVSPGTTMDQVTTQYLTNTAIQDIEDIFEAEILVLFTVDPKTPIVRGGRHFESGFMYGLRVMNPKRRVITVGPRENIFHYLPDVHNVPTWGEAKTLLEELSREGQPVRKVK